MSVRFKISLLQMVIGLITLGLLNSSLVQAQGDLETLEKLEGEEARVPGEIDRNYCMRLRAFNDCGVGKAKISKGVQSDDLTKAYHCYIQKQMQTSSKKKSPCSLQSEMDRAQSLKSSAHRLPQEPPANPPPAPESESK